MGPSRFWHTVKQEEMKNIGTRPIASEKGEMMSILVSLTPSESKRLIGKAAAAHPLIKKAFREGNILVSNGTTTGYFLEELLNSRMDIARFACGVTAEGVLCQSPDDRIRSFMIKKGQVQPENRNLSEYEELDGYIDEMKSGDVYVKGANAIDPDGNAGFFLAHPTGGNIMKMLPKICAQNVRFLIPVGLEKLIPSVVEAQRHMKGIEEYSFTFGRGCGNVTVTNGIILHELASLELLTGVKGWAAGAGGVGGSEGAVSLVLEGDPMQEKAAVELIKTIKGEPAVPAWKKKCSDCTFRCKYRFPEK